VGLDKEVENEMEAPVREEDGESENDFCGCGLELGDKTLKARFGVGENTALFFDFAAGEVIWGSGARGYLTA